MRVFRQEATTTNGTTLTTGSLVSGLLSANTFAFVGDSRQILMQIEALKSKTNVKILESPSILALDGTQASFNVGIEYPYSGGSLYFIRRRQHVERAVPGNGRHSSGSAPHLGIRHRNHGYHAGGQQHRCYRSGRHQRKCSHFSQSYRYQHLLCQGWRDSRNCRADS